MPEEIEENIWGESRESKRESDTELFVGKEAFTNYYKKYRKVSQDPERYQCSPSVAYIKESYKMNMLPAPFGLIKRRGRADEVNVKHYNIGNQYGRALGGSIKHLRPRSIILASNKSSQLSASKFQVS